MITNPNPVVYLLRLQNDCWYVGYTLCLKQRLSRAMKPRIPWLQVNRVIAVERIIENATIQTEVELSRDMAKLYGLDKVRGGPYTRNTITLEYGKEGIMNHELMHVTDFIDDMFNP